MYILLLVNHSNKLSKQILIHINRTYWCKLINAIPPLLYLWRKNCLRDSNTFLKWKILHEATPETYIIPFYNSDFQIHKQDNKFWGKLFNIQWLQCLLLLFSVSNSTNMSLETWAVFWSFTKSTYRSTKIYFDKSKTLFY